MKTRTAPLMPTARNSFRWKVSVSINSAVSGSKLSGFNSATSVVDGNGTDQTVVDDGGHSDPAGVGDEVGTIRDVSDSPCLCRASSTFGRAHVVSS